MSSHAITLIKKWPPDQPCDKIEKSHIFYDGVDVSQHADIKIYENHKSQNLDRNIWQKDEKVKKTK